MRLKFNVFQIIFVFFCCAAEAQDKETVEITAQSILARVDRIMQYPVGELQGRMKHIFPDGNSFTVDFKGKISRNDFLFHFSSITRGESLKVLYNMAGEDIWVYNIHALKLFHKMGVDKYDLLAATNFSFIDLSNSDYQSNYNARITGRTVIKGVDCYRLYLEPLYPESTYGALTMYVSVEKYHPLRIDFHDRDKVIFKFMTLAKIMENGDRAIPLRYDMLNIKDGTVTILSFSKFENNVKFQNEIFRPEKLGE
ncbi:MAG TPA: outer membrane lipoprotein-sorting protein [Spirochaetota bacterium]|nr:outer membrane lipoprotein-sorting protein [Spirochaetota bacterium]HPF04641.1 outer membrane lipoprotein-sorting protein [Spirochaetota bacterium]HPJ42050.1 outer membrane lipoprotein-sorting protein [Spirochaetota bacterium]HPR36158.1 outer membrane lipoprotein-sorting protein [Spirochaetota bacterium]HRX46163.1 outer membrane lipoprotein-sorting protein [Spirochaetota bacterium]